MKQETHIGDLSVADLDAGSAFIAGQCVETSTTVMGRLGKPEKYAAVVVFLRAFAGILYDLRKRLSAIAAQRGLAKNDPPMFDGGYRDPP